MRRLLRGPFHRRPGTIFRFWLPALLGLVLTALPGAAEPPQGAPGLTPQEERGKQIYLRCESPTGGEITALMGEAGVEVPASALPCANCHGHDGKGNPEGGVTPTNLTWEALTKPYGVRHESGRDHPPYTPRTLKRAIAMGTDPAGNPLHVAMPRYRMSIEDMETLVAYIRRLGADPDPGVDAGTLHLGTLLPPAGRSEAVAVAISSVLAAYLDEINASGGLYSRRLVLHTHRLAADPAAVGAGVEAFLEEERIFALVGAFIAGADEEIPSLAAEHEVPLVGPFTLRPQSGFPVNRQVFYLFSGLATQGAVLADLAVERHGSGAEAGAPAAVVIYPREIGQEAAVEAVEKRAQAAGWTPPARHPVGGAPFDAEGLAGELAGRGVQVVFGLHPEVLGGAFLTAADRLGWHPEIYAPGVFAGGSLFAAPAGFEGRIFLAFPSLPGDQTRRGVETYRRLTSGHDLPGGNLATQLATLASAEILVEGLKRAGRDVSREKLIEALEGLYEYSTGLVPEVTYNPNRHIGALGAYVVAVGLGERRFEPVGGWREAPR